MGSNPLGFCSRIPLVKGVLVAFLFQLMAVLLLAILFHFTSLSDQYLGPLISLVAFGGVVIGGACAAKAAEAKYLVNGLGVGLISLIVILVLSLINGAAFEVTSMGMKALNYLGAGIIGGLLGALWGK